MGHMQARGIFACWAHLLEEIVDAVVEKEMRLLQ